MSLALPSTAATFDKNWVHQRIVQTRTILVSAQLSCRTALAELAKVAYFLDTRKESARLWALDADITQRLQQLDDALQALETACDGDELLNVERRLLALATTPSGVDAATLPSGAVMN